MLTQNSSLDRLKAPVQVFSHPEPARPGGRIWPVFMPFSGCPYRCVYCAQEKQTGQDITSLDHIYQQLALDLDDYFSKDRSRPLEIAFFGGTFTALPVQWQLHFLRLASSYKSRGLLTRVRCSTRPDCVSPELLSELKAAGLDMVELGIQSFSDEILKDSRREYSSATALDACGYVRRAGLSLGIQLLPGLPGSVSGDFACDIDITCSVGPDIVRLYPCLVVRGTVLEKWYRRGEFKPWSIGRTQDELAFALLGLWRHGIPVIRSGVALEESFARNIVAGPVHEALGQEARSRALYLFLRTRIAMGGAKPRSLDVPAAYSGEFWGHRRSLSRSYARLGLARDNVRFHSGRFFRLFC